MEIVPIGDYWDSILKSRETTYVGLVFRLPPRLWRPISQVQAELKKIDKRQLYCLPSTFHVSVKGLGYLGERFDESKFELLMSKIGGLISEFRPFRIRFRGLGVFPTNIYVKVEDEFNQLQMINKRILEELKDEVDRSEYDGDAYIPHATIATFNTKDAEDLLKRVNSSDLRNLEFGESAVFTIEAVEVNMVLALGPEETQESAFRYVRSFHLG